MKSEWNDLTLGDVSKNISRRFNFGTKQEVVFINTGDVLEGKFLVDNYVESDGLPGQAKKAIEPNDILFTEIRPANKRFAFVDFDSSDYVVSTKFMVIKANKLLILPKYLYLVITSNNYLKEFQHVAESRSGTFPQITFDAISYVPIRVPDLTTQQKIVQILVNINDKIELNRKMNQTLEEMAQILFKSWFVDFDPVHAKAKCSSDEEFELAAKELGISKEVLDLFPSKFEESELGMIPKGWEIKKFGDIVTPKKGKSITQKTIVEGNVPVVAGGLTPAYYHNTYNVEAPVITISASGANAGYVKLYNVNIWASDCSYINKTNSNYVFTHYVYLKLKQSEITWMQQGAAQPHIYPSHLMRLNFIDAGSKLFDDFENLITPMFKKIAINELEIKTLQQTRDTLLPKLLSGEIDVSEFDLELE